MVLITRRACYVQPFFQWFNNNVSPTDPWLILGKGPSFALRSGHDLGRFHLLSLNHAVREQPVLVAHVIDLDVIQACAQAIEKNARVLVMPWYPHARNFPGQRTLEEIVEQVPVLSQMNSQGRLLWYDLSTSPIRHGTWPVIQATYFSAEAALNLLAYAGVRQVRSLGVDGGSAYSGQFEDLRDSTLLANGRSSFDLQFAGFARTILRTGVDFAPLDLPAPARVYVAATPAEVIPAAVLRHSIRRHCSLTIEVETFSHAAGVEACQAPAILLPVRAQVLADLRPLWRVGVGELEVMIPPSGSGGQGPGLAVVGAGLGSRIPALAVLIQRRAPVQKFREAVDGRVRVTLAADWNPGSAGEPDDEALVLYYPSDGSEPWISRNHPLGHLWVRDLLEAVLDGQLRVELVAQAVREGHVRPSLLYQVEHGLVEPLLLPRRARILDRDFSEGRGGRRMLPATQHWAGVTRALARHLRRQLRVLRSRFSNRLRTHLAVRR